jgi:hypothetical protein
MVPARIAEKPAVGVSVNIQYVHLNADIFKTSSLSCILMGLDY